MEPSTSPRRGDVFVRTEKGPLFAHLASKNGLGCKLRTASGDGPAA